MRSAPFDEPRLLVTEAGELPLSGPALLDLMRAVLDRGVPIRFRASGWSMAPFVRNGDVITVSPFGQTQPRVGEIVAFTRPKDGSLVVHRVVSRLGDASLIAGDAVEEATDGIVPRDNILGRVTCVERRGKVAWLGLGPERILIAWLSRKRWLTPLRIWLASRLRLFLRWQT